MVCFKTHATVGRSRSAMPPLADKSPSEQPIAMAPILSALASAVGLSWKSAPADPKIGRNRAGSDCSTAADSDSAPSGSECGSPRPQCGSPPTPTNHNPNLVSSTVIIFDWDDTLLPTTCIRALANVSRANRAALDAQLSKHAAQVEVVLRAARCVGNVSIVTLSKQGWVPKSARLFLPGINIPALFRELGITVHYAQEESVHCPGALAAEDWTALKRSAMAKCLDIWHSTGAFGACNGEVASMDFVSVVSVGDAEAEQLAAKSLTGAAAGVVADTRLLCKTVKLMDQPTLGQLGAELMILPELLPKMAAHDKDVDLIAKNPSELASKARAAGL